MVITGLIIILAMVLVLPFMVRKVEENLELFLFTMGVAATLIAGKMNSHLILEALEEPVMIAAAVLVAGALFFIFKEQFARIMAALCRKYPVSLVVVIATLCLGLLSSVITAIVASIILVEVIYQLPLNRKHKVVVCILACYSIGLGAVLTPIGEPLATIAISRLGQNFFYLLDLIGKYIIPSVFVFSLLSGAYCAMVTRPVRESAGEQALLELAITGDAGELLLEEENEEAAETWHGVIMRSFKVYLFVMALVFLGEGFEPLINKYILGLSPQLLYWVNTVSAVLDNATLCAAEVSPAMLINPLTIKAILMGLLISGGMLIPGNIPNIISASKLRIGSKEWALIGGPVGILFLALFYVAIFVTGL